MALLLALYPLGHDLEPQAVTDRDDRRGERRLSVAGEERAVHLEDVDGKPAQVAERGVPRSEVVHRNAHAELFQVLQARDGHIRVEHHHGLGDLEDERRRGEPAVCERVLDVANDRLRLQLLGGEVDADRERVRPREPSVKDRSLPAGFAQHPGADRNDQTGFLGQRDEVERRDEPALRVVPAEEGLDAVVRILPVEAHDRLVVHLELLELDRLLKLRLQLQPLDDPFVHRRLEEAIAPFAVALRHVHRDVRVP